jgi:hypothetical protein
MDRRGQRNRYHPLRRPRQLEPDEEPSVDIEFTVLGVRQRADGRCELCGRTPDCC